VRYAARPYQRRAIDAVRGNWRDGKKRIVLVSPTGAGKCLGRGTPVLRYDGRIVAVENVRVGDLLMGPDSTPRTVLSTAEGYGQLYEIVPLRGESWVCNDEHILTLVETESSVIRDVPLKQWLSATKWFRHLHKQFMVGVDYGLRPELPIDPYFLGVWLGDGSKHVSKSGHKGLTGVQITKPDPEIEACVRETAETWGLKTEVYVDKRTGCPTWRIVRGSREDENPLLIALRDLLGPDLEVPLSYLTASREQRLQLLAGLVDTDGHLGHGVDFVQKRKSYADAFCQLARSVGFKVTRSVKYVNGDPYHRMCMNGDLSEIPLRIARKRDAAQPRKQKKNHTRTGFRVEQIEPGPYFGFELDGDGRFLLGDFTVTHNTFMAGEIIEGAVSKGNPVLFLAHRKELIEQASKTLDEIGVDHGVIKSGHYRRRPQLPVQVASIQTLVSKRKCRTCDGDDQASCTICNGTGRVRRPFPAAKVVVIDEAHRCLAQTYQEIINEYPDALILGLTATPWRLDRRGLGCMYNALVETVQVQQLVNEGYLLPIRAYAPDLPDLGRVKTKAGDYDPDQVAMIMGSDKLVGNIVEHWKKLGEGRRTVLFAASVTNSMHLVDRFKEAGIAAEHLDGAMKESDRDAILARLAAGTTRIVSNVDVLVEGYDLPSLGCVVLARPTKSLTRYLQQVGRGMRPYEDQTYMVLIDHSGCVHDHGLPTEPRRWSLDDRPSRREAEDPFIPPDTNTIECKECGALRPDEAEICPVCGATQIEFARFKGLLVEREEDLVEVAPSRYPCPKCSSRNVMLSAHSDLELELRCQKCGERSFVVDREAAKQASEARRRKELARLREVQKKKGFKDGWTGYSYKKIFGTWPPSHW